MVGVQATQNVLAGERYKTVNKEVKAYLHGEYGRAPGEVDKELIKKVLGDTPVITERYADTLEPEFEKTKQGLGDKAKCDEDVLSYIAFPTVYDAFYENKKQQQQNTYTYKIEMLEG